ncbi:MAG: alanine--tRNA ligase-related protein, partial [Patescibacteria group bacterium]
MLSTNDIRQKYLDFFAKRGHTIIPSSSLVPENDPTTLFTGSGMQPMISYLLGEKHAAGTRIADSQKCFRSGDIEEVGDNRHTTFFEMLGNWSLGDYFKQEQIPWMYEFLTKELELDPKHLYVTVFRGSKEVGVGRDEEAVSLWTACFTKDGIDAVVIDDAETGGMQNGRIFSYPEKKNWWSRAGVPANMPIGEPGGPDTEMFWDFGIERGLHEVSAWKDEPCHVNCDCGRFIEIGNNVFMEYVKTDSGFEVLPQRNVDF